MRSLRRIVTALLLLAGLMLGLLPAGALAAGPGVTLTINTQPQPIDIPGSRFAGGMTIRALLQQNGVAPEAVTFVNVTRADSGQIALKQGDFGAVIIDDGKSTRFVHGAQKVSATAADGPIQIAVNGGDIKVTASVSRGRIEAGESATFSVRVQFAPPGARLRYTWDFGDGSAPKTGLTGTSVSHVYNVPGNHQARVSVSGAGGSTRRCATSCVGTDSVDITVGEPPEQPPAPASGSGAGDANGSGTGSGTGSGQGGSGGTGSGTGSDPAGTSEPSAAAAPEPKPKPKPKPKKPFGVTISGVLIDDVGAAVRKLPGGQAAGAPRGGRRSADGPAGIEIPLTGLLAMIFVSLGALRERRGVKLRLA